MTYFEGFIVPVPEANKDSYQEARDRFAPMVQEFGVGRMVESWDSDVPEGKVTDFRKAVDAKPDEKIVFSWFEYPSKQARDAANQKMMSDPRMADMGSDMPFDGKRMVMGGFDAIVEEGSGGGTYTDGFVVPVPEPIATPIASWPRKSQGLPRAWRDARDRDARRRRPTMARSPTSTARCRPRTAKRSPSPSSNGPTRRPATRPGRRSWRTDRMQHGGDVFEGNRMFWGGFDKSSTPPSKAAQPSGRPSPPDRPSVKRRSNHDRHSQ